MNKSFEEWMYMVNQLVYNDTGFEVSDLPDEEYRINYDYGMCPKNMAKIVITNYYNFF
jgi:hypothetical protein